MAFYICIIYNIGLEFTYFVKIEFSIGERKTSKNLSNRFEIKISEIKEKHKIRGNIEAFITL